MVSTSLKNREFGTPGKARRMQVEFPPEGAKVR